jgi:hypothetical protein
MRKVVQWLQIHLLPKFKQFFYNRKAVNLNFKVHAFWKIGRKMKVGFGPQANGPEQC